MRCPSEYKPPISRLATSLQLRRKEYLRETNLHAISYFVDPSQPKFERLVWLLCTILSTAAAFGTIFIVWNKFQTEPTFTGFSEQTEFADQYFPGMMLCVNWTFLNQTELSEDEKVFYEQIYEWNWKPINTTKGNNIPDGGYKTTFEQRTPSCDTIYRNCMVGGDRILCDDLFVKELSPVGACCRLILSKLNTDRPSKSVTFEPISYPIRSYIVGDLGLYPPRNRQPTFTFTIPIQVHLDMKMTQSTASLRLLTRRQRGCIFSDEEETLDCCILRCQKRKILGICGCLPWFLASSEEPECSIQQYSCLIQHADRLQHPKCNCRLPCRHIAYDCIRFITKKNFKLRSSCEYVISHWPTVQYQRKTLFGWLDLLVSFGGVAGLFLGYSLLTSVEFIYYFTLRSYCGAVLNTPNQRHNIVRLRTVKPKAQMNLNGKQKYYNYIQ